ncbi:hypothetical protein Tco_1577586 [Tanacetum coccineum]
MTMILKCLSVPIQVTTNENGVETEVPPKTAQALLQRQRERKAKSILLLAIPDEYQLRFHRIKDAKSLWAAIKSRFDGNVESKKMQKTVLKQQFENFSVFEAVSKFSGSSSNSQNVAFLSVEDTSSSHEVNTANVVSTASGHNSQRQASSSSYTDDLISRVNYALIVQDGLGYGWSYIAPDEPTEFALMAYTSNSSGSDTEVQSCFKNCVKTYEKLQKQFDEIGDRTLMNSLKSVTGKYVQRDGDDNQTNDRFKKDNGYHAVPPPLTGNYMPLLADLSFAGLDDSVYGPTTNKTSASVSQVETSTSQTSNTYVEMPRVESVRPSGVIIKD